MEQLDGFVVQGNNAQLIKEFKEKIMQAFEMIDLGLMTYFLGMEVKRSKDEVFIF